LEVVGLKGTILMNTFTYSRSIFSLKPDFVFDPKSTVPYTGLVPSTLVKREDMIRSRHPTRSITAIGYLADYLTKDHDEKSNPYLPYEKLAKVNGKYLCIGIGNRLVAIRHEAQRRAGLFKVPVFLGVYFKNLAGNKELHIAKIAPCKVNLHNIVPKVEEKIKLTRSKIGFANSILANTNDLLEAMTDVLQKDPQLSLCEDFFCFKCRELERRLDLYSKIKSPRFFQKYAIIRTILFGLNKLVLSQFRNDIIFDEKKKQKIINKKLSDHFIQALIKIASTLLRRKQN
jgi:aminoglycoside N3'-acetyltransferase